MAAILEAKRMLVFFYPNNDYLAADLSGKVQILAAAKGLKVYSPPRNFLMSAYKPTTVAQKLQSASHAVFLANEVASLDDYCQAEIGQLSLAGVPIHFLVPYAMAASIQTEQLAPGSKVYGYDPADLDTLNTTLQGVVTQLTEAGAEKRPKGAQDKQVLATGGLLLFFALLILLIMVFAGNKK